MFGLVLPRTLSSTCIRLGGCGDVAMVWVSSDLYSSSVFRLLTRLHTERNSDPPGGGMREKRDRGGSDNGENDEGGTTARWHEGCSENRRETAKRDRKRRTPKGGRRLAHHTRPVTPLLKIPVWWRRAVLPSLPWVVCVLAFFLLTLGTGLARTGTNTGTPREPPKRLLRGRRGT